MVAGAHVTPETRRDGESRFVLHGVPWWTYVTLRDVLDDQSGVKMTYLRGALELARSSILHVDAKTIIARLIEVWAMERDVDLRGFGGATFRREAKERGLEPDECYKLGKLDDDAVPDIAIEVIVTSGVVDKMAVYAGLGVPEVLPDLDLAELAAFVRPGESQTQLAKAYQAKLRGG